MVATDWLLWVKQCLTLESELKKIKVLTKHKLFEEEIKILQGNMIKRTAVILLLWGAGKKINCKIISIDVILCKLIPFCSWKLTYLCELCWTKVFKTYQYRKTKF